MSLTQKLILYALAIALLPLVGTGFTLVAQSEAALQKRIREHQITAAAAVAAKTSQAITELGERLTTALALVDPFTLSAAERLGLLRLLHRQSEAVTAVVLLERDGQELAPPLDSAAAARLRDNLPGLSMFEDGRAQVLVSPVYFPALGVARVAMGVACCADAKGPRALAGIELGLEASVLRISGIDTGEGSRVFVVDRFGRVVVHPTVKVGDDLSSHGAVKAALASRQPGHLRFENAGATWAAAHAAVGELGWSVVVEQPEAIAFASAAQMRRRTLTWLAVTLAVVLGTGFVFAGRLRRRVLRLVSGARAFGAGRLGERLAVDTPDELGELSTTMNAMAGDLERSLRELEAWNRTLEARVEERTRELKEAQAQLLTQSKLAAIGQLGAGVAHEVNNPLAGILGYTQILLQRRGEADPDYAVLKKVEEAAQRCKVVTSGLLKFSQRGLAGRTPLDVNRLLTEVLELMQGGLGEAGIEVRRELAAKLPEIQADAGQLSLVLINLITNARNAMTSGGVLTLSTEPTGDGVRIGLRDTGHGIAPEHLPRIFDPFFTTKRVWTSVGLGLSVAYRIVTDHGGRIDVESVVSQGSLFTIALPKEPPPLQDAGEPVRAVLLA